MTASSFVEPVESVPVAERGRTAAEFVRYFGCSAAALAADAGLYALVLKAGAGVPLAAALGFVLGLAIAYALSVRFVFRTRRLQDERAEFAIFAAVGVAGLLLTEVLLWLLVGQAGLGPLVAKFVTAGAVFCFNFGARKALLFTRRADIG